MAAPFDPYLKWLGIPPKHQPPNAYRLLGVELFESDADVIDNAADQRMAHLRNFAGGQHSEWSQKILNEIATARVRLLNTEQKTAYDEVLRNQLEAQKRPAVRAVARPEPRVKAAPVAKTVPVIDALKTETHRPVAIVADSKQRSLWMYLAAIAGGVLVVIIVLAFVVSRNYDDEIASDDRRPDRAANGDTRPDNAPADDPIEEQIPPDEPPIAKPPQEDPKTLLVLNWPEDQRHNARVLIDDSSMPVPATGNVEYPLSPGAHVVIMLRPGYETIRSRVSLRPGDRHDFQPVWQQTQVAAVPETPKENPPPDEPPKENPPPDSSTSKKLLPPDADTKRKKIKEIRYIYKQDFADADNAAGKLALAKQLSHDGEGTINDPASRFVLFETAIKLATEGGDLNRALAIIDRIDRLYAVDALGMKAAALSTVAKAVLALPGATANNQKIVSLAGELRSEALSRADVKSAGKFVRIAIPAARKLRDNRLVAELQASLKELDGLQKRYDLAQKAVAALRLKPDHPKANEVAGCWYCFIAGDWQKGLPWLAKAEDAALAELAGQDLACPKEPVGQVAVGNQWYEIAKKRKGLEKSHLEDRAVYWYKQALSKLTGLGARKLENRLKEMGVSLGDYALKFDGQKSHLLVPNFAFGTGSPITVEALVKPVARAVGAGMPNPNQAIPVRAIPNQAVLSNINTRGRAGFSLDLSSSGWTFRFYYMYRSSRTSTRMYERLARVYSNVPLDGKKWSHVAGVFDGNQVRLYVDGQLKRASTVTNVHSPSQLPFVIGAAPSGTRGLGAADFFHGQIKSVRISKTPVYTASFAPPAELHSQGKSTVLLLRFDEGSGNRAKNAKGGKMSGEIHDAQWVKLNSAPVTGPAPSPIPTPQTTPSLDHLPRRSSPPE